MQVSLKKTLLHDCNKYMMPCLYCRKSIFLDKNVLLDDSKMIYCYKCNKSFKIVGIVEKNNNIKVNIEYKKDI